VEVAKSHDVSYIFGDPEDVLKRLIQCGRAGKATDIFRVTTECPWFAYALLPPLWEHHVSRGNDITVSDQLPEGLHFEIYSQQALERSHDRGTSRDRSEICSNYPRNHPGEFRATVFVPRREYQRTDLRVTVDYPEDLVVAREIARALNKSMPLVSVGEIIQFLDSRHDLKTLVAPFASAGALWQVFPDQVEFSGNV
jgi:spore coat polysaccharide biosynthesis protein SpsF